MKGLSVDEVMSTLRSLPYIREAKIVGSYAAGKEDYKDIDVLLVLLFSDADLWKRKRDVKKDIVRTLKLSPYPNWDIFIFTSDGEKWRLKPWVVVGDPDGKVVWDWE